jgi:hypothetical protein
MEPTSRPGFVRVILRTRFSLSLISSILIWGFALTTNQLKAQITFEVDLTETACPGMNTGEISITQVQGGTPPYSFSIDNGMMYQADSVFSGLPPDQYYVRVMDNAGMISDSVPIHTDPEPTAICDRITASVETNGIADILAFSFDGGSLDNCNTMWYRVRRMDPSPTCITPDNPDNLFFEELRVCCDDIINDSVMVQLRVYDRDPGNDPVPLDTLVDRSADCMTVVYVRDHQAPEIVQCAPDTTVDCREDFSNLDRFGTPSFRDNCYIADTIYRESIDLDQCQVGVITREFVIVDHVGLRDSCTQTIEVINFDPFDGLDTNHLKWPEDVEVYECSDVHATHPDSTGYPMVNEDICAMVAYFWEDDVYEFAPDACVKIRRNWSLIDWCQYERGEPRTPENGYYTHIQDIKIIDTVPPDLTGPVDTLVLLFTADCDSVLVELDTIIASDCASDEDMEFKIEIDFQNNGTIDKVLYGKDASGNYPPGEHLVTFIVDDKCNNIGKWETLVTVQDGKAPNPVIRNKLIVPLMNMGNGGMAFVTADQLNLYSYDNCTPDSELHYSFSSLLSDTIRFYDCDSLGDRLVEIWVTDEEGNQGFAITCVSIQDNENICPATITSQLGGVIHDVKGTPMNDIRVLLQGGTLSDTAHTDSDGLYAFNKIGAGQMVSINIKSPSNWMQGISTKDIILIQQHLLGTREFSNPYEFVAADLDKSGHVSTKDILLLRKLILGIVDHIPQNDSWRFFDRTRTYVKPEDAISNSVNDLPIFEAQAGTMSKMFDAVKVGDVSGDGNKNYNEGLFTRNNPQWDWNLTQSVESGQVVINATSDSDLTLRGFQIEIEGDGFRRGLLLQVKASKALEAGEFYWAFTPSGIRIHWVSSGNVVSIAKGEKLMDFNWSDERMISECRISNSEERLRPEFYLDDLSVGVISLGYKESLPWSASVVPNPSAGDSKVVLDGITDGKYKVSVYGISGYKVYETAWSEIGHNNNWIDIRIPSGNPPGLYIVRVVDETGKQRTIKWNLH